MEDYYDRHQDYDEAVAPQPVEALGHLESSSIQASFEKAPTTSSVSEFSIANAVNLRGEFFY